MIIDDFYTELWMNKYENDCMYNLSETCAAPVSLSELLKIIDYKDDFFSEMASLKLDYGEIVGSQRLRNAISQMYEHITPECITIAHGGIGANSLTLMSLVSADDHVISVVPSYQQHYSLPESIGAEISLLQLKEEDSWQPDLNLLESMVKSNTKLICLNNPNNPTGAVLSDDTLQKIISIARKKGIYIFCDEVYRGLNHENSPLSSSIADLYEKGISTGSMSKAFSLPGVRLGWIAGPSEIIEDINRHRDYHIISVGKIDDLIASVALENKDAVLDRNVALCRRNISILSEWIDHEEHISFVKPSAATTSFLKFDISLDSQTFCRRLQTEAGVMLVPGSAFTIDDHVRLGYGNHSEILQKGLDAFSKWLKSF